MNNLIYLIKKYIVFLTYFMNMYPLNNGRVLVNSIDKCKCGNTKKMITYLFDFDFNTKKYINSKDDLNNMGMPSKFIVSKIIESRNVGKSLMVEISLGIIDHTFILDIYNNNVYVYQSFIEVNPLVITKLNNSDIRNLFYLIDKISYMSTNVNNIAITNKMMDIMVSLFGIPSQDIKYSFGKQFSMNTKIYDEKDFYRKMIILCNLYNDNFIKKGKYISYEYLNEDTPEFLKRQNEKYKTLYHKKIEDFFGKVIFLEYVDLTNELKNLIID